MCIRDRRITAAENELDTLHQQQAAAQIEVEKPFPQEEELAEKSARLAELNAQLDVDEKSHDPEQDEEEQEDAPRRPSVLALSLIHILRQQHPALYNTMLLNGSLYPHLMEVEQTAERCV